MSGTNPFQILTRGVKFDLKKFNKDAEKFNVSYFGKIHGKLFIPFFLVCRQKKSPRRVGSNGSC